MLFNIPQFIDTEDKVVGPFTAKQMGWMIAAAALLFMIYLFFGKTGVLIAVLPVGGGCAALAFYRPYGQPLTYAISSIFRFLVSPKMYVWRRIAQMKRTAKKIVPQHEHHLEKKTITEDKVMEISRLLDSEIKKPL